MKYENKVVRVQQTFFHLLSNREILFRGKATDKDKWAYGVPIKATNIDESEILIIESVFECEEYACRGCNFDPVIPETLGQYTGLNDKNGKKVFEGDIVKKGFERYVVKWNAEQCRFDLYTNKNDIQCGFNVFSQKYFEIIGNLQDNPELLGDK